MAQHAPDHRDRRLAFLENAAQHSFEPRRIAFGRRHHRVVEIDCGAVADREPRFVEIDPAAVAGIETSFSSSDLVIRRSPPRCSTRYCTASRPALTRCAAQRLADHGGAVARRIGVARDRRRMGRGFEKPAQRRGTGQLTGLDDDEGIARRLVEKAGKRPRQIVAGAADANHAPAAEEAELSCLVRKPRRIGNERGALEIGHAERVAEIGADAAGEKIGSLAHQTRIRPVKQDRKNPVIRPSQKSLDPCRRELHNFSAAFRFASARCAMNSDSRVTISWFNSATERTAASSSPTTVEYWFGLRSNEFWTCTVLTRRLLPL